MIIIFLAILGNYLANDVQKMYASAIFISIAFLSSILIIHKTFPFFFLAMLSFEVAILQEVWGQSYTYTGLSRLLWGTGNWLLGIAVVNALLLEIFGVDIVEALKKVWKKTVLIILLFFLFSCNSVRKVDLQKSLEKTEIENKELVKTNSELFTQIESIKTENQSLVETLSSQKKSFQSQISELLEQNQKESSENSESFLIENAKGEVKISDTKGNNYQFTAGEGTKISKTSISKLQSEISQRNEVIKNQSSEIESLQKDLKTETQITDWQKSELQKKNKTISEQNQYIYNLKKELEKETIAEKSLWWFWLGLGVLICILVQLLWKRVKFYFKVV